MQDQWTDQLSDYLDDELTREERLVLEGHLAQCADCRRTLQDLQRVVATAGSLAPQTPSTDLWNGIAERIEASRVVPFDRGRRRFAFTMPEIAAAAILLATLSGGAVALLMTTAGERNRATSAGAPPENSVAPTAVADTELPPNADMLSTVSFGDAQYEAAVLDLQRALDAGRGQLDESTISVVEQNLSIIDRAIAEARSALAADPSNGYLSGHLVETRRRKLELLRRAATLVAEAN